MYLKQDINKLVLVWLSFSPICIMLLLPVICFAFPHQQYFKAAFCNSAPFMAQRFIIRQFLFFQRSAIPSVQRFINEEKLPHLLFYGPPGTGKTSTILACAKQLYKDKEFNSMVLEVHDKSSTSFLILGCFDTSEKWMTPLPMTWTFFFFFTA